MNNNCTVCDLAAKYKCPTCRIPYCSVQCCKKHKETPCQPPPLMETAPPEDTREQTYEYPTEDTVPIEKLKLLENSGDLKKCLSNPHVRTLLEKLDKSPYPDELIQEYMQEPIFTEFVDECLKIVQPKEDET